MGRWEINNPDGLETLKSSDIEMLLDQMRFMRIQSYDEGHRHGRIAGLGEAKAIANRTTVGMIETSIKILKGIDEAKKC